MLPSYFNQDKGQVPAIAVRRLFTTCSTPCPCLLWPGAVLLAYQVSLHFRACTLPVPLLCNVLRYILLSSRILLPHPLQVFAQTSSAWSLPWPPYLKGDHTFQCTPNPVSFFSAPIFFSISQVVSMMPPSPLLLMSPNAPRGQISWVKDLCHSLTNPEHLALSRNSINICQVIPYFHIGGGSSFYKKN